MTSRKYRIKCWYRNIFHGPPPKMTFNDWLDPEKVERNVRYPWTSEEWARTAMYYAQAYVDALKRLDSVLHDKRVALPPGLSASPDIQLDVVVLQVPQSDGGTLDIGLTIDQANSLAGSLVRAGETVDRFMRSESRSYHT